MNTYVQSNIFKDAALFTVTRNWKQPEFPSWRLIKVWHSLE